MRITTGSVDMVAAPLIVLPLPVRPLSGETVTSYLHRLAIRNAVSPARLRRTVESRTDIAEALAAVSGYDTRALRSALPQLRPGFGGLATTTYRRCPACAWCALAGRSGPATVWAGPERVVCRRHRRWIGGPALPCRADQQFTCASIPGLMASASRHHALADRWGATRYTVAFAASIRALRRADARGLLTVHADEVIADRRRLLLSAQTGLSSVAVNIVAWYPATVAHTAVMLRSSHTSPAVPCRHGNDLAPREASLPSAAC